MKIQWIIAALFLTAACMTVPVFADAGTGSSDQGMIIGMPDPSAVWAAEMGYGYATRVDEQGGQYGVVILPDGTERDAWEAYREYLATQDESNQQDEPLIGMPNPSAVWADEMGYQYVTRTDEQGGQYGVIILPDGTERDAWEAYREYLAAQGEGAGSENPGGPTIFVHDHSALWSGSIGSRYFIPIGGQDEEFVIPDGGDAWNSLRERRILTGSDFSTGASSLLGTVQSSRQSLLERLLSQ